MQTHTVLQALQNATIHVAHMAAQAVRNDVRGSSDVARLRIFPVLQMKHGRYDVTPKQGSDESNY